MSEDQERHFWEMEGNMEVLGQRKMVFPKGDSSDGQQLPEGIGR